MVTSGHSTIRIPSVDDTKEPQACGWYQEDNILAANRKQKTWSGMGLGGNCLCVPGEMEDDEGNTSSFLCILGHLWVLVKAGIMEVTFGDCWRKEN